MDNARRFRFILFIALAVVLFGEFVGHGIKSKTNRAVAAGKFQQKESEFEVSQDPEMNEISSVALKQKRNFAKMQITDSIRDSCLPKMLCEMASKPDYMLAEKEKDLLYLIRSSTMSLALNTPPSKWHFAAQMGELLRYTRDNLSGPMGCAQLWPSCPISSTQLMKLSYRVKP